MEPCACNKQAEVELQCKHVLCESCAYSSVAASGSCPRCHVSMSQVEQKGANLKCQFRNIRVSLLMQEDETIHSVIVKRFKIPRNVLKVVSKGCVRSEEDAMDEWKADPGQVFFVVGSPGDQKTSAQTTEAKAAKMRESLERFKEWQRVEQERLAASQRAFEAKQSQTCMRRVDLTVRRLSQAVTQNGATQGVMVVLQGVGLFFSTLFRPFEVEGDEITRARAIAAANEGPARRGMGGIRRPETHTTPGMGGG